MTHYYEYGNCDICKRKIDTRNKNEDNSQNFIAIQIPIKKINLISNFEKIQDGNYNFKVMHMNLCPECAQNIANIIYDNYNIDYDTQLFVDVNP